MLLCYYVLVLTVAEWIKLITTKVSGGLMGTQEVDLVEIL